MSEKSWTFHDALRAVLLFHDGEPWGAAKRKEWLRITGIEEATTATLCDHVRWVLGGGGSFEHREIGQQESAFERVYCLAVAGHCLTAKDAEDIQTVLSEHNEEIGEGVNAFHLGRVDALRQVGGSALVEAVETLEEMRISESVDRALAKFRQAAEAKRQS